MLLFIDTSTFLSFYEFTTDDIEELKKLHAMIAKDKLTLLLPSQVVDEFWRNRDERIARAVAHVRKLALRRSYPRLFQGFGEYERVRELEDESDKLHKALLAKAESGARSRGFPADLLIESLFEQARQIDVAPKYIQGARERRELGRPPGKGDSLGDAVNWEALLAEAPSEQDLHFVSGDSDWVSPVSPSDFNSYLNTEWESKKKSQVTYYPFLSTFFGKHFPEIKLEADVGVELLIRELLESPNFASTHAAIVELDRVVDFTPRQAQAICQAYLVNDQVHRIIGDEDVAAFLRRILLAHGASIDPDEGAYLEHLLKRAESSV